MTTSPAGRSRIIEREGRRLSAYRDSKGVLTIGVGHTGRMSPPPVRAGMTITEAECDAMLAADLGPVERTIAALVKVPLTTNEFDALASWLFNVGAGALRRSTVLKRLNAGDTAGAAAALMMWVEPPALAKRRRGEMAQFLSPDPATALVVAARAGALKTMAADAEVAAARTRAMSGAAIVTAASAATAAHAHPTASLAIGGAALVAAVLSGLAAWHRAHQASALAVNAATHAALAGAV